MRRRRAVGFSTPAHAAIFADGNRRWAKKRGKSRAQGCVAGIENVGRVLEWSRDIEVRQLSFWGFSTENPPSRLLKNPRGRAAYAAAILGMLKSPWKTEGADSACCSEIGPPRLFQQPAREHRGGDTLMRLFRLTIGEAKERNEFHENGIRFRVFRDRNLLPGGMRSYIAALEDSTRHYATYFANAV
jgi:undecaprenyl pyrophosphate synthase